MFDLPRTDNGLADVQLEFALLDWDRVTKNEVMGIESFMFYFANFKLFQINYKVVYLHPFNKFCCRLSVV